VYLAAGDTLFSLGDIGMAMYVIVEGRMRVHIDDQAILELGELEIVGELAALDPAPRSASVSALVPSRLFRIEQETLLDLMTDQPEIVRGVIRELARRIRRSNHREGVNEPGPTA
jgi:CRP-like cAMP-binding protein